VPCVSYTAERPLLVTLSRFRIVKLSLEAQKEFGLPELICADPESMPFFEGEAFYQWITDENACEPATAMNYLRAILLFLTFLWESSPSLRYTEPAEIIRNRVRDYLRDRLGCVVRPHRNGNFTVKAVTTPSARLFLTALRRFYFCAALKRWYSQANPLEWSAKLMPGRNFEPRMPAKSGLTLPRERKGRCPDTYFCIVSGNWRPQVIDDPEETLPGRLLPHFTQLRDRLVARILFESGARISEVLSLTLGDWRKLGLRTRTLATDKGAHGERVKEIWWSTDMAQLLRNYINQERRYCDRAGQSLDDLPDSAPLFLTVRGDRYTYDTFYAHWQQACDRAKIKITPHQVRHWYVTRALRRIDASDLTPGKREAYRQALIAYLGWHSPETIKTYDHHLRQLDFGPLHAELARLDEKTKGVSVQTPLEAEGGSGAKTMPDELKQLLARALEPE
jgi:hypothetical protein